MKNINKEAIIYALNEITYHQNSNRNIKDSLHYENAKLDLLNLLSDKENKND